MLLYGVVLNELSTGTTLPFFVKLCLIYKRQRAMSGTVVYNELTVITNLQRKDKNDVEHFYFLITRVLIGSINISLSAKDREA
jgi:hypothetical protein